MAINWNDSPWLIVFHGLGEAEAQPFDCDGWQLHPLSPSHGRFAMLPSPGRRRATIDDAQFVANCLAFDHDAPVSARPLMRNDGRSITMADSAGVLPFQPLHPDPPAIADTLWDARDMACAAAAQARLGDDWYGIRYGTGDDAEPSRQFTRRFDGRRDTVALYAMAARQADLLSEYMLLWRVLEVPRVGGRTGSKFAEQELPRLDEHDFGVLPVYSLAQAMRTGEIGPPANAFAIHRERARAELDRLAPRGTAGIAKHLYGLRNGLAHGKLRERRKPVYMDTAEHIAEVTRALPIVKLLARVAVEDDRRTSEPSTQM